MKRLIYLSEASATFSKPELLELAKNASTKNKRLGVTGYLHFSDNRFIQYIEGENEVIDTLIDTIKKDQRHSFIYEIESDQHEDRLFPSWDMRLLTLDEISLLNVKKIIGNFLLDIKNNFSNKERATENVWNFVNIIAIRQNRLDTES